MKKYLMVLVLSLIPFSTFAATSYSQSVSLEPGWNVVSTPRVLESHTFSLPETSGNFDVYVLNASSSSGWSTLADMGQTEFTPLYGYFINNKSVSTQTLTFNYKASTTPNERIFERAFTKTGWYSIGVANPTYAKISTDGLVDTDNPSRVLNSLSGSYESVLDLTDESFPQNPNSVAVGDAWKQGTSGDVNTLNDLRESKGYVVYINQSNSFYSGFQNNDIPEPATLPGVSVVSDPSFTATKVTGGATNISVAQYKLTATPELTWLSQDVKISNLQVTFATTTISRLNNVSLYVNGGQVGASQNFTGQPLSYNLGSSVIIPKSTAVTLTIKADIVNTDGTAHTSGTIAAVISGVSNAQTQTSNEVISVPESSIPGNTLTIVSGIGAFAKTVGFSSVNVSPNTSHVKVGSFTLQASPVEDIRVSSFDINPAVSGSPYTIANLSNLTLKSGSVTLGTPVGSPVEGTTTFSFADITIPANGTSTFDIYADIGSATSGSVNTSVAVRYRGAVSNTITALSASGVDIITITTSLSNPTLSASSPVSQFVVGGSTFGIATFTLKTASAGTQANVRELRFSSVGIDAIESITVGGVTAPVLFGSSTVTGLNISVGSVGTDVPVTVKFAGYQGTTSGGSLSTTVGNTSVSLTYVEATSGSGTVIVSGTIVPSNTMIHVASKPTVTVAAGNTNQLVLGAENKVGEFTVTADVNGKISIDNLSLTLSGVGITGTEITSPRIADGNTTVLGSSIVGSSTMLISFSPRYEVAAGQSKTFNVYATVNGAAQSGITPYISSRLTSGATFNWRDVVAGDAPQTGASIYNFPTNSFTTAR